MGIKLPYSKFVSFLLNQATDVAKKEDCTVVSINHLMMAVLSYYMDNADPRIDEGMDELELKNTAMVIADNIEVVDFAGYIEQLKVDKTSFLDDVFFKRIIFAAEEEAIKNDFNVLRMDILLGCIFATPTKEIRSILNRSASTGNEAAKADSSATENNSDPSKQDNLFECNYEDNDFFDFSAELASVPPIDDIEDITREAKYIQNKLSLEIFGQDNAIGVFASGYFQAEMKEFIDKGDSRPKATFLFAGPPGVGKTFLAEKSAELLRLPYKRFDMSEFSRDDDAVIKLCGTHTSYKSAKEGELTGFVARHPECVLLFDEIEKAHIVAIHLFLQVLDAGRLRDANTGKDVDFSKAIVIFTTNAGREIYEGSETPNLSHIPRKTILKALENDVDPKTGKGVFPAAICSRFATGNVVMFNHMEAHVLRGIAEKEISRSVKALEDVTDIRINISENVYSAILFAEGGMADARTIKSRAKAFFNTELYELFRLLSTPKTNASPKDIKEINIDVEIEEDNADIKVLFTKESTANILVFATDSISRAIKRNLSGYNIVFAKSYEDAVEKLDDQPVDLVLCDLYAGNKDDEENLNVEDVDSEGSDFLYYICSRTDLPVYIAYNKNITYTEEEMLSLKKIGARGTVNVSKKVDFEESIKEIFTRVHQQSSMNMLASANKIVYYKTSQTIDEENGIANISLYDLKLETAVDSADKESVMSALSRPDVKFDEVIGADGAKDELKFFVDFLKNPQAYKSKGLDVPKGVLFYGPPGTGKTLLAKAVAGESGVTFISAQGNQFMKKYSGEGEAAVRQLFLTARKYAPTIIFIDEVDAFAKERRGGDGNNQPERILTTFLAEMDGFNTNPKKPVFVLAATNFEIEPGGDRSIDPAFVRRFDRSIYVDLPDKKARIRFINMKLEQSDVYDITDSGIENLAIRSNGMSLANLEMVLSLSKRIAFRQGKDKVDNEVLEEAFETYNFGDRKSWNPQELRKTAYHEAGHAFLYWHSGEKPSYLTIVARGGHGGYMGFGDTENRGTRTKKQLLDFVRAALGGRACELVFFGDEAGLTTGPSDDLKKATSVARSIVCDFGMDDSMGIAVLDYSNACGGELGAEVRKAVNNILNEQLEEAKRLLKENRVAVDKIVEALMDKTSLSGDEIDKIFSLYSKRK